MSGAGNKLAEMEERLRRAEDSSKENKNALSQLISHTKNVERAVTTGQQDMIAKREAQGQKIQEIFHKMAGMQQNRETLERTCYNLRDEVSLSRCRGFSSSSSCCSASSSSCSSYCSASSSSRSRTCYNLR